MKTMSKPTGLLALLAVTLLILSACAGNAPSPPATSSTTATIAPSPTAAAVIRISTTTSVNDSGLLTALLKVFQADTGYKPEILSNGSGAAIKLGESGDADVLLVHAIASEEDFIAKGFGMKRIPLMHNFFVLAGTEADPAKTADKKTAGEAFRAIAKAKATFVSRGDDSGTHKAELTLWKDNGIDPTGQKWYISSGKGMGATLVQAAEMQAYCLTDKATFLAMADCGGLRILLGESIDMKNTYSMIAVNPDKNPGVNVQGAKVFIDWMLSEKASGIIKQFGNEKHGQPLFFLGE